MSNSGAGHLRKREAERGGKRVPTKLVCLGLLHYYVLPASLPVNFQVRSHKTEFSNVSQWLVFPPLCVVRCELTGHAPTELQTRDLPFLRVRLGLGSEGKVFPGAI
jgi:hypothetical protein